MRKLFSTSIVMLFLSASSISIAMHSPTPQDDDELPLTFALGPYTPLSPSAMASPIVSHAYAWPRATPPPAQRAYQTQVVATPPSATNVGNNEVDTSDAASSISTRRLPSTPSADLQQEPHATPSPATSGNLSPPHLNTGQLTPPSGPQYHYEEEEEFNGRIIGEMSIRAQTAIRKLSKRPVAFPALIKFEWNRRHPTKRVTSQDISHFLSNYRYAPEDEKPWYRRAASAITLRSSSTKLNTSAKRPAHDSLQQELGKKQMTTKKKE